MAQCSSRFTSRTRFEVFRHVDDDGVADGLSGQAGPAPRGRTGTLNSRATSMVAKTSSCVSGNDDADRFDFINAGIGAVQIARGFIEADFTGDSLFQSLVEIIIHKVISRIAPPGQEGWLRRRRRRGGGSGSKTFPFDLEPPPRPLHQRKLRDISLDVASTPPGQEGR